MSESSAPAGRVPYALSPNGNRDRLQMLSDRDRTLDQLGRTVAALAEKFDVRTRARTSVRYRMDAVHDTAGRVGNQARSRAGKVGGRARDASRRIRETAPAPVLERGARIGAEARKHPLPVLTGAGLVAVVLALVGWRMRRR